MKMDILDTLNEEQLQVVTSTEGYVRVIAGAGSGKTKALTHRYAYLVNELGISTANILCVTFTNKAANEMKKRIRSMIGDNDTGYVCTFHGFCVQVLKEDIHVLNYPKNFIIIDSEDVENILNTIYKDMGINSRNYTFKNIKEMIERRKNKEPYLEDIISLDITDLKKKFLETDNKEDGIFYRYLYEQKKNYALDFDDLINYTLYIFKNYKESKLKWQQRIEYVMVDEFQDVSSKQYALANILSKFHKNLFIVGDPDQTIYSWRGARVDFILNFDKAFQDVKTIIMDKNYRSSPEILSASNSLIRKNKNRMDKELKPIKSSKVQVLYNHSKTSKKESEWIVKQIKLLLDMGKSLKDIVILYRAHYLSRSVEESFIKEDIKYTMYSGIEFYKRKEIKDVLCYLRMIIYADDISFNRIINVPRRNFGEKRVSFIKQYSEKHNCSMYLALKANNEEDIIAKTKAGEFIELIEKYKEIYKEMNLSDLVTNILNDSGYEALLRTGGEQDRLDNLAELKQSISDYENTNEECSLEDYLEKIALFTNLDQKDNSDSVKMMTIHTSKGLEFPCVFVCGLNEGVFPTSHVKTINDLEEERRLAYVAYTRAEEALFLSDSEGRNFDNTYRYPSRFIFNIERELLKYEVELDNCFFEEARNYIELDERRMDNLNLPFKIDDVVEHKVFGKGRVMEINREKSAYIIKFDNMDTNRSINFEGKLELVRGNN